MRRASRTTRTTRASIRFARRRFEKKRRVPTDLAVEIAGAQVEAYQAWVKAREESSFAGFRPQLERMLDLKLRLIECFAPYEDPYDVLLDDYEEGVSTADVRAVFAVLQPEISALVAEHAGTQRRSCTARSRSRRRSGFRGS